MSVVADTIEPITEAQRCAECAVTLIRHTRRLLPTDRHPAIEALAQAVEREFMVGQTARG